MRVSVTRDGLPEMFQVSSQWPDTLPAVALAGAVMEACQAALRTRGEAWSRALERSGWQERLERLEAELISRATSGPLPAPTVARRSAPGPRPQQEPDPLALELLAEQAMSMLDELTSPAARARHQALIGTGVAPERALAITLSPAGQVTCQADPGWVRTQTGAELSRALNQAVAAAREDLAGASAASRLRVLGHGQPYHLAKDALATLDALVRATQHQEAPWGRK